MPKRTLSGGERTVSVLGGALLLFGAAGKRSSLAETLAGGYLLYRGLSGDCPITDLVGNLLRKQMNINIRTALQVRKPVGEVYAFWRKLDNLPLFMKHLDHVEVRSGTSSHWRAKMPGVGVVSWDAVIVNEKHNETLGWSSVSGASVYNAGKVTFREITPEETRLDVIITYRPPMGSIGENVARMFTPSFEKTIREDIAQFKDYMEAGFSASSPTDFRNQLI